MRLKAFRGFAAGAVALMAAVGCETEGETVPVRSAGPLPITAETQPVLVAAAETSTPIKVDKPAAAADVTTNTPAAAPTTAEATAKAAAEVGAKPSATDTNAAPAITQEIPPERPANLKISDATEKVLKLTESNLDEKVILTFVQQTPTKFELDADEIVYLSDVGVPSTVIAAMLKHDGDDPGKAEKLTAAANTENVQPAIPANTNLPPAIAQNLPQPAGVPQPQAQPGPLPQGQEIEVTTNYVPNPNQVVVQQQPPQTVVVQQPTVVYAQPETVTYFYDSLSPYGSWFYVSDYGWCWQPTVAVIDQGWRPYGPRGNWVWTDSGWYWRSDYTWGWAPFHYGRWYMHGGRGWIWVPDRVWGPSWVTWRSYGDYCGWAPLPPHAVFTPGFGFTYFGRGVDISFGFGLGYDAFCFAPVGRFHHRRVYDYCLPRHEVVRVFEHSHVSNRWEYGRDRREFVNRAGPRLETGVKPAVVRTMSDSDRSRWGARERVEHTGRDTVIYRRPTPPATSTATSFATGTRSATPTWSPRTTTRAEVSTRPSTTSSGIATAAGQPTIVNRRGERGSADTATSPQVVTRSSDLNNRPAPTRANEPQVINPATRGGDRSRVATTTPAPAITTPAPTTTSPSPVISTPSTRGEPRSVTSATPSTADTSPRIRAPQVNTPPTTTRAAGEPQIISPATRRPLADAAPVTTTPLPGSPNFNNPPRTVTTVEPAPTRREVFTPSTPAPAPTTVAPAPRTVTPPPTYSTPAPTYSAPSRVISPPSTPSAPTYSAPTYTPPMRGNSTPTPAPQSRATVFSNPSPTPRAPVIQSPVSRGGGEPNRAGQPNTVSPGRRGRD